MHTMGPVDVSLVLDKTQSAGAAEKREIATLTDAKIPFLIGSSTHSHIMHHKFMIVDGAAAYMDWLEGNLGKH